MCLPTFTRFSKKKTERKKIEKKNVNIYTYILKPDSKVTYKGFLSMRTKLVLRPIHRKASV